MVFYKATVRDYGLEWIELRYESNRRNIHYAGVCALLELNLRIDGYLPLFWFLQRSRKTVSDDIG